MHTKEVDIVWGVDIYVKLCLKVVDLLRFLSKKSSGTFWPAQFPVWWKWFTKNKNKLLNQNCYGGTG